MGIKIFKRKVFWSTVPKSFVGEPFSVSIVLGHRKNLGFRVLCHDVPSKILFS